MLAAGYLFVGLAAAPGSGWLLVPACALIVGLGLKVPRSSRLGWAAIVRQQLRSHGSDGTLGQRLDSAAAQPKAA